MPPEHKPADPPVKVDLDIETHMLRTYVSLRRLIAVVTFLLLAILLAYKLCGDDPVRRTSISAYYHHDNRGVRMHDVFVVALAATGLLLIAYQGYTDREKWATNVAGAALLVVVGCPMEWPVNPASFWPTTAVGWVHIGAAVTFFLSVGYVCLFRARDTLGQTQKGKPVGNAVYTGLYWITGALMVATPPAALLVDHFGDPATKMWVYWLEFFGVTAFLSYWVVKNFELEWFRLETPKKVNALAAEAAKDCPAA